MHFTVRLRGQNDTTCMYYECFRGSQQLVGVFQFTLYACESEFICICSKLSLAYMVSWVSRHTAVWQIRIVHFKSNDNAPVVPHYKLIVEFRKRLSSVVLFIISTHLNTLSLNKCLHWYFVYDCSRHTGPLQTC